MPHKPWLLALAALLAPALFVPASAAPVAAASDPSPAIAVQRAAAKGDTLRFTFSIDGLNANANAVLCKLGYDTAKLQLKSASLTPGSGKAAGTAANTSLETGTAGVIAAEWHDLDAAFSGGELLTADFTALADFTETTLTVQKLQIAAWQNDTAKMLSAKTALVQASGGAMPGDVNLDGEIDTDDLLLLSRALVGLEDLPGFTYGADADGSGEVDTDDLLLLSRALAGLEEIPAGEDTFSCKLS